MTLQPILLGKMNEALQRPPVQVTRRDAALPSVPKKAHAVIGMRRAGKTTFLFQIHADRLQQGQPPERTLYFSFDDDRLANLPVEQLSQLVEEYYRRFPRFRRKETVTWLLDEIQLVDGWERFVRRLLDTEKVEVIVSGSSAKMLSREVHSSLRGRGMETIIRPFSFREFLRHRGAEPVHSPGECTAAERSLLENLFSEYLIVGGFPEAQGLPTVERLDLLQGYVNTVLFRDVVERHRIARVASLRWLTRQLLKNAAAPFSVHKLYRDFRSQGHSVSKDALHAMMGNLEDAFLIRSLPLATESERRRNSNPRKIYPVDAGLIAAYDQSGRANTGHALETIVLHELDRRKTETGYVRTPSGFEVDFHAQSRDGREELIQVCTSLADDETLARELRALTDSAKEYPRAKQRLLVLTFDQLPPNPPPGIIIQPAYEWLLEQE